MKKIFLFLLFSTIFLQAQDGAGQATYNGGSEKLTTATGVTSIYERVDHINVIDSAPVDQGTKPSPKSMSLEKQNFEWISTKKYTIKNKVYYALLVEKWEGSYKYPALKEEWEERSVIHVYVFEEKDFNKVLNLKEPVEITTTHETIVNTKELESEELGGWVEHSLGRRPLYTYYFSAMKTEDGHVRFLLPESYSTKKQKRDFSKQYFETDIENFSKLTTIK